MQSENPITKKDLNRLRIRIYREFGMSQSQKEKVKQYDRKKATTRQLKIKSEKEDNKQSITQRKTKSRAKLSVPESLTKDAKLVQKVIKVTHADPVKLAILSKSFQSQQVQVPKKKQLSLLELQSLKRKNRKQEHASLVEQE